MFISDEGSSKSSLAAGYSLESVLIPALALKLTGVTVSCRWNYRDRCFRLKEDLEGHAGTCWPSCGPLPLGSTVLTNPRLLMNMEARHLQLSPHRPTWSIWLGWGWRDGLFRSTDCWQSPRHSDILQSDLLTIPKDCRTQWPAHKLETCAIDQRPPVISVFTLAVPELCVRICLC